MKELMEDIASDDVLQQSYEWLCQRRKDYSHNDDVWLVRYHWTSIKSTLQVSLLEGRYRFSPLRRVHCDDEDLEIWSAMDSLVLKAIAIVLTNRLAPKLSANCHHLAGNGGSKAAVRAVAENIPNNKFVFRTDVN